MSKPDRGLDKDVGSSRRRWLQLIIAFVVTTNCLTLFIVEIARGEREKSILALAMSLAAFIWLLRVSASWRGKQN
jgi:hypothetical protein